MNNTLLSVNVPNIHSDVFQAQYSQPIPKKAHASWIKAPFNQIVLYLHKKLGMHVFFAQGNPTTILSSNKFPRAYEQMPITDDVGISKTLLNGRKLEILRSIPKYNSHCHLGGEIPIEILLKYASEDQAQALIQAMQELSLGKEYEKAFCIFPLVSEIINTHERLKEATYQTCERFRVD